MKLIQDLGIKPDDRVLLRCDLNLPQDENGQFTDFFRLESSIPTIDYLLDLEANVFIIAHLGSPKGKIDPNLSLRSLAPILEDQLNCKVQFIEDPFDTSLDLSNKKGVYLIENIRFWPGEEDSSIQFAKDLVDATKADFFIQDAFGVVHRSHASLVKVPELITSAAGILLQKEIECLSDLDTDSLNLIVGGAKVESKLPVIENFIGKADAVLTGGVVANTFLKANGQDISSSLFEESCIALAGKISAESKQKQTIIVLPEDCLSATSPDALLAEESDINELHAGQLILDIGRQTIDNYKKYLDASSTVIWAGTLGFAENPVFAEGSTQILKYLLHLKVSKPQLKIIIGGGDTVDFARGLLSEEELTQIAHLSTGGGASLLMLSGQALPGITALNNIPSYSSSQLDQLELKDQQAGSNVGIASSTLGSKTPILIANLKAHFDLQEIKVWMVYILASDVLTSPALNFCIAPPSLFIEELQSMIGSSELKNPPEIIAQNISSFKEGAETGEVSASQLKGIASGAIIGHSERRDLFKEDDIVIFEKINRALETKLRVVLCVGGKSINVLTQQKEVAEQLKSAIVGINSLTSHSLTVAYEPVFAVGAGEENIPTEDFLTTQLTSIRTILSDYGLESKVLYGGSVNETNCREILDYGFDGLLVGSAGLDPKSLQAIGINISA